MASDVACTEMNVDHDSGDDLEDHLADHGDMQSRDMTREYRLGDAVCAYSCTYTGPLCCREEDRQDTRNYVSTL